MRFLVTFGTESWKSGWATGRGEVSTRLSLVNTLNIRLSLVNTLASHWSILRSDMGEVEDSREFTVNLNTGAVIDW